MLLLPLRALAAPYAAMVMDARTGEVLYSNNSDARLHPASLTKMMTLYIAFEAIRRGEISLETKVKVSRNAASEPPSKLGLAPGQVVRLQDLIRAASIKSANDAATAIGEAIEGSEAAFAKRMNRTAKALGMTRTTFRNAHGLTADGHLSTAHDMTILGRHLLFDYPEYYNLFSRRTTVAAGREVANTNRRLLAAYEGADGIKTGYTRAAGFNLVASAKRGNERIIATVFGGTSSAQRNAKVAELLDMGFRKAPSRAPTDAPSRPVYTGSAMVASTTDVIKGPVGVTGVREAGKTIRLVGAVRSSLRPRVRPGAEPTPGAVAVAAVQKPAEPVIVAMQDVIDQTVVEVQEETVQAAGIGRVEPKARPGSVTLAAVEPQREVVSRVSTSGGRHWGINIGRYASEYKAERVLLQTALNEMATLDGSLRKVVRRPTGYDANFLGMTRDAADLACRRLNARNQTCFMIGPG